MRVALVGLVLVSHSSKIAEGLAELAAQMAGSVALIAAGGTDDGGIGTSFDRVAAGIAEADSGAGVVVLCDLGSAILTAETALDFLDDEVRGRVVIADAPLVEGAVSAAVAAETGATLEQVRAAAEEAGGGASAPRESMPVPVQEPGPSRTVRLINPNGLHARPAADFVTLASTFAARVNANGKDATSLLGVMSLGLLKGDSVTISASGADAQQAVEALAALVESGFGEA
ncbi:PTS-dependent dihydroxyacetone kinase phosphotransferase subunit DhaM [Microbacteriaceae bacterium VKM Ac-2855]|nr:PTS-dependent dihydroxyacetone kinase phosphotransferase subunit DhaM [Microbacteriaceae bacterium VKM Ac-2855]